MLLRLAVGCGLLIAAGVAVATVTGATTAVAVVALGDVSQAHIVEIRDHRGVTLLTGEFRSRVDLLGNIEKDAALVDRRGRVVVYLLFMAAPVGC